MTKLVSISAAMQDECAAGTKAFCRAAATGSMGRRWPCRRRPSTPREPGEALPRRLGGGMRTRDMPVRAVRRRSCRRPQRPDVVETLASANPKESSPATLFSTPHAQRRILSLSVKGNPRRDIGVDHILWIGVEERISNVHLGRAAPHPSTFEPHGGRGRNHDLSPGRLSKDFGDHVDRARQFADPRAGDDHRWHLEHLCRD